MRRGILLTIAILGGLVIFALLGMVVAFVLFLFLAGEPSPHR